MYLLNITITEIFIRDLKEKTIFFPKKKMGESFNHLALVFHAQPVLIQNMLARIECHNCKCSYQYK